MRTLSLLIFTSILFIGAFSQASAGTGASSIKAENLDADCRSASLTENKFTSALKHNRRFPFVQCDRTNLPYRVQKALTQMKTAGPLNDENQWDQIRIGDPWEFFTKRVAKIGFAQPGDVDCDEKAGSGTVAYASAPHTIIVCKLAAEISDLDLLDTLVHEARHAGADGIPRQGEFGDTMYPHTYCKRTEFRNEIACDQSTHRDGAYAVSFNTYLGISRSEKESPALRKFARSAAIESLNEHFVDLPDGTGRGLVFVRENNQVDFYDGEKVSTLFHSLGLDTFVSGSLGDLRVFNRKDAAVTKYEFTQNLATSPDDTYFTDHLPQTPAGEIIDNVVYTDVSCFLFEHSVRCWNNDDLGHPIEFALPQGVEGVAFFTKPKNLESASEISDAVRVWIVVGHSGQPRTDGPAALQLPDDWKSWQKPGVVKKILASSSPSADRMVRKFVAIGLAPQRAPGLLKNSIFQLERETCSISAITRRLIDRKGHVIPSQKIVPPDVNAPEGCTIRMISDFYWGEALEKL